MVTACEDSSAGTTELRMWAFCNLTNATGPGCNRTDDVSCFGRGVVQYDGACECDDPAITQIVQHRYGNLDI